MSANEVPVVRKASTALLSKSAAAAKKDSLASKAAQGKAMACLPSTPAAAAAKA